MDGGGGGGGECTYYGEGSGGSGNEGPAAPPPRMPGGGGPGGVDPPLGAKYPGCTEQQKKNIEWAIDKMCGATGDGSCLEQYAPTYAECIKKICDGKTPPLRCGKDDFTRVKPYVKVPNDVDCSSNPDDIRCLNLINSVWHELLHWCGSHWPWWPTCASERMVAGCTIACGSGVGIGAGSVQDCPPDCKGQAGDCVDKIRYLPCRDECGDKWAVML